MTFPAKLTPAQRANIIETRSLPNAKELAEQYGVSLSTIYTVRKRVRRTIKKHAVHAVAKPASSKPVATTDGGGLLKVELLQAVKPFINGAVIDGDNIVVRIPLTEFFRFK